jgi:energy-converting hydrogenase Eha subunit E
MHVNSPLSNKTWHKVALFLGGISVFFVPMNHWFLITMIPAGCVLWKILVEALTEEEKKIGRQEIWK